MSVEQIKHAKKIKKPNFIAYIPSYCKDWCEKSGFARRSGNNPLKVEGTLPFWKCLLSTCCFYCNRIKIRLQAQIDGGPAKKQRRFSTFCTKTAVTACLRAEARLFRAASRTTACRRCIPARRRSARARRGFYAIFPDSREIGRAHV